MSLDQFLVDSWSYSRVTTFARNEKAFEMNYIFGIHSRLSATTIAGQAYHAALEYYFVALKAGRPMQLPSMEKVAYEHIDEVKGNAWKLQKTTPTIDECKKKATTTANALLRNFMSEIQVYDGNLSDVLDVELYCNEDIAINGVDIPLPCHCRIDLVIKTIDGKTVIIDHKSKATYTGEDEIALSIGIQAITYVKSYEAKTGQKVDEVWFIENKYSQNKDGSPQLRAFKVEMTEDNRRLYEALLYEPLRRLIQAVNDPDYVYMINDSDNFVDRAELYDFWARTMIAEVEDFNVADDKKELVRKRLKKIRDSSIASINPRIIKEFKENAATFIQYDLSHTNMTPEEKIEHVLRSFGIIVRVAHKMEGYSSNTFLLEVSAGVKISSIHSHRLDIANALDVANVRISSNLVVYDGKSYLAVEFVKKREGILLFDPSEMVGRKIPIGKDNFNNTVVWDVDNQSTPHALICGATGSGKSVSIKSTIEYATPVFDEVVICDPKFEFSEYANKRKVNVSNEILAIETKMSDLVKEMNNLVRTGQRKDTLVVFDEFADAVAQSRKGKDLDIKEMVCTGVNAKGKPKFELRKTGEIKSLEENLRILLQKGRSAGYRIMAATQRASVKVITGDAKVNFPVQICFRVPKAADSCVVLDEAGAESLAGAGDGLIKSPEYPEVVRFQAFYKPTPSIAHGDEVNGQSILIIEEIKHR